MLKNGTQYVISPKKPDPFACFSPVALRLRLLYFVADLNFIGLYLNRFGARLSRHTTPPNDPRQLPA